MDERAGATGERQAVISPRFTGRVLQGAFFGIFLFGVAIIALVEITAITTPAFAAGAAIIALATALPFLPGLDRWGRQPWSVVLPMLDFVGIAVIRIEGAGGVTNPLVLSLALPAVWAGVLRSRGALWAFLPAPFAVVLPDVVRLNANVLDDAAGDRAAVLVPIFPLLMVLTAVLAHIMAVTLADRQEVLEREHDERLRAALESERTRRLLDAVLDSLDVGVAVLSPEGEPLLMNRRLRESPEVTASQGDLERTIRSLQAFERDRVTPIPPEQSTLSRIARGEEVQERLAWVGFPGGPQRALQSSGGPVTAADGTVIARVMLVTDVTDFVTALEAKDVFIATVSHELRTPLTTIAGFLELILEHRDELDPAVVGWLAIIGRNIERQQMVVRDLLAAASSRRTALTITRVPADLGRVAAEAAVALGPEADQKHIVISVRALPTPGVLDPLRLAQVAENLLSNAVRYTPDGGRVAIEARDAGDMLELIVRDTGVGIEEEDQRRLFDEFFRSASARASSIRGVGLGLAVVRSIVDAHGGEVHLESEPGAGTTVTVRIPRE